MEINIGVTVGQGAAYITFAAVSIDGRDFYFIRLLERAAIGENLAAVSYRLTQLGEQCESFGYKVNLVRINLSGIGRPLIDLVLQDFVQKHLLETVYLSGGARLRKEGDDLILPKELMISRLKILKHLNRVRYDQGLVITTYKGGDIPIINFFDELQAYETKVSINEMIWDPERKIGEYDDLAIALGLACWDHQGEA